MGKYTSIQIGIGTRKKLLRFKEYARETYDEILNKLMAIVEKIKSEGELSDETKKAIEEGRRDMAAGRAYSTKKLLKALGVD